MVCMKDADTIGYHTPQLCHNNNNHITIITVQCLHLNSHVFKIIMIEIIAMIVTTRSMR